MFREFLHSAAQWLRRVVTEPRDELGRWQRTVRFAYDLMKHGGRQLRHDRASQMAAALAFRTIFALIPVLVVATIAVKAISGTDAFLQLTHNFLAETKLADVNLVPPADAATPADATVSLSQWLEDLVREATDVNLAAVGWIGFALIIYAAISLMVTIEDSFNSVYRAPEGRPWSVRVPLYWFVLTISPVAMGITWFIHGRLTQRFELFGTWIAIGGIVWSVSLGWMLLFAVYKLIPSTTVGIRPALVGAFASSVLLEIGKRFFDAYLSNAFSISHLYGSLGLIPLFMFWMYLMWLAVLFGLEVSATLQMIHGRDLEETRQRRSRHNGLFDPVSVVTVMEVIAARFNEGKSTGARFVAEACSLPEAVVVTIVGRLVESGILHRVETEENAVALARPPEQVTAEELIEIGFQLVDDASSSRHSPLVERLRLAQRSLAGQTTLANLSTLGTDKATPVSAGG